jgi:hypothetical protein
MIMPALSMFFGLIIYMYAKETHKHHRPHIHVEYQDSLESGNTGKYFI